MTTFASVSAPAAWLVENAHFIPHAARVLDVACGRGRHALWLAQRGFSVHAVDRDRDALAALGLVAASLRDGLAGGTLTMETLDLESAIPALGTSAFDAVVVFNYLHRPLMPALVGALRPGGVLIYETFTIGQAARGRPRNPAFLLEPGELLSLVSPLHVLRSREGDVDGKLVASVVARRE